MNHDLKKAKIVLEIYENKYLQCKGENGKGLILTIGRGKKLT